MITGISIGHLASGARTCDFPTTAKKVRELYVTKDKSKDSMAATARSALLMRRPVS